MIRFISIFLFAFSCFANAEYWKHIMHNDPAMGFSLGWEAYVIRTQLNHWAVMWKDGDVVELNVGGNKYWVKFLTNGNWSTEVSADEKSKARAKGTIVSEEGGAADDSCPPEKCRRDGSPLIIDLDGDGFKFGGETSSISFDIFATNSLIKMNWVEVNNNDAFLVYDVNGNGRIDNGSELFGEGMRQFISGEKYSANGFVALAQFDKNQLGGNFDGVISKKDAIWNKLMLWIDKNSNGISENTELIKIKDSSFSSFDLNYNEVNQLDVNGNTVKYTSFVNAKGNSKSVVADVYFLFPSR